MQMKGVIVRTEGTKLFFEVDTTQTLRDTGKSEIVGESGGWQPLGEVGHPTLAVNLTVCRKRGGAPWRQKAVVS